MVSEISGVGFSYTVTSQTSASMARQIAAPLPSDALPRQSDQPNAAKADGARPALVAGLYSQLRDRQEEANKVAASLRETGEVARDAKQALDTMSEKLAAIVKMYPPYPVDSPERISLLNTVSGLRRQIDELTFPPPERLLEAEKLLGLEEEGEERSDALQALQESMWDIPTLDPEAADDASVAEALKQVQVAKTALEAVRGGMWEDVVRQAREEETPLAIDQASQTREMLAEMRESSGIGQDPRALRLADEAS